MAEKRHYRTYVPLMNQTIARAGREQLAADIAESGATFVMLALQPYVCNREARERELAVLRENCRFFHSRGLGVGAWTWTLAVHGEHPFTPIRCVSGSEQHDECCPMDPDFRKALSKWIGEIAACGVDAVLLDDDYRFGFYSGGVGCICRHHMTELMARVGTPLTVEEMPKRLLSGGANRIRDAWIAINGEALEGLALELRAAVDAVDPKIRLGICSSMSLWDMDGTTPVRIAGLLAGSTKPLLRTSGAPYWAVRPSFGQRLKDVMDFSRMQNAWWHGEGVEVISEGDTYPRPRTVCPASYLELFDLAMRADAGNDGILKYMFDYHANADCERGYLETHLRGREKAEAFTRLFEDKEAIGVRVWELQKKFAQMTVPACMEGRERVQYHVFSPAAQMLTACSVPTVYEGMGQCGIAFGENVRAVPKEARRRGLILDARAAEILTELGVDVGIRAWQGEREVAWEYFCEACDPVEVSPLTARVVEPDARACVKSRFFGAGERELLYLSREEASAYFAESGLPASYLYENEDGERYLVLLADAYFSEPASRRSYRRREQVQGALAWLCREEPTVTVCTRAPELYAMVKRDAEALTVGLWNCSPDPVFEPTLQIKGADAIAETVGCEARLTDERITCSELAPFSAIALEVHLCNEKGCAE